MRPAPRWYRTDALCEHSALLRSGGRLLPASLPSTTPTQA
jgi:hypothetical protein